MAQLRIQAPAKVNLILRIFKKRSDGYHGLCSLFHRIDLCDELTLRSQSIPGLKLAVSDRTLSSGKNNIVSRAYEVLCTCIGRRPGLSVILKKNIPVGAGLGGGSSDAASFLIGANRLLRLKLSRPELLKLGASVGSDVPFFIEDTAFARIEGRGELIKKLPCKRNYSFVVVAFGHHFSTKEMYKLLDRKFRQPVSLTSVRANVKICASLLNRNKLIQAKRLFQNDFLPIAEKKLRLIHKVIDTWRKQDIPCLMSGSGSSVFAVFDNVSQALQQAKHLKRQRDLKVFVAASYRHSI